MTEAAFRNFDFVFTFRQKKEHQSVIVVRQTKFNKDIRGGRRVGHDSHVDVWVRISSFILYIRVLKKRILDAIAFTLRVPAADWEGRRSLLPKSRC